MEKLLASLTLILGLMLATWGSVLLGIDALGAPEFVEVESGGGVASMQTLWLTSKVNTLWRFLVLAVIGLFLIWWISKSWVIGAFGSIFTFFAWRLVYGTLNKVCWAVVHNPPVRFKTGDRLTLSGCLAFLLLMPPWAVLSLVLFLAWVVLEFGVTLPTFFVGERVIQPRVRTMYRKLAERARKERDRGFRETALVGMIYLFGGFVLQIAGTAYLTVSDFQIAHRAAASPQQGESNPVFRNTTKAVRRDHS